MSKFHILIFIHNSPKHTMQRWCKPYIIKRHNYDFIRQLLFFCIQTATKGLAKGYRNSSKSPFYPLQLMRCPFSKKMHIFYIFFLYLIKYNLFCRVFQHRTFKFRFKNEGYKYCKGLKIRTFRD